MGLEPTTLGTTIRCSNQLSYSHRHQRFRPDVAADRSRILAIPPGLVNGLPDPSGWPLLGRQIPLRVRRKPRRTSAWQRSTHRFVESPIDSIEQWLAGSDPMSLDRDQTFFLGGNDG